MPPSILVPASLVYDNDLSPAAVHTWLELRGLAGEVAQTPPLNLAETGARLGKSQSALYHHMALLRSKGVLHWQPAGKGQVVFSFPGSLPVPVSLSCSQDSTIQDSTLLESRNLERASLNSSDSDSKSIEEKREALFRESGNLALPASPCAADIGPGVPGISFESMPPALPSAADFQVASPGGPPAPVPRPPSRQGGAAPPDDSAPATPAALYQSLTRLRPNRAQRDLLHARVTDLERWRSTLEHWLAHRWSPKNIPGMLDLYARGGASGCAYCGPAAAPSPAGPPARKAPQPASLDALAELRREQAGKEANRAAAPGSLDR